MPIRKHSIDKNMTIRNRSSKRRKPPPLTLNSKHSKNLSNWSIVSLNSPLKSPLKSHNRMSPFHMGKMFNSLPSPRSPSRTRKTYKAKRKHIKQSVNSTAMR